MRSAARLAAGLAWGTLVACGSNGGPGTTLDRGTGLVAVDAGFPSLFEGGLESGGDDARPNDAGTASRAAETGTAPGPPSRFITQVIDFHEGTCAGYNDDDPDVVKGPPVGAGTGGGSGDVLSLGLGGSIVVGFGDNEIVDGPGVDFVVFENPFVIAGGNGARFAEPGEVAVSDDGVVWTAFPCTDTTQDEPDGGWGATQCAGINPVLSNPNNAISPFDLQKAGGDQYDLHALGVAHAKYVRIRNVVTSESCALESPKYGFDLDAIAIINPAYP